jgi:hypothetical protein
MRSISASTCRNFVQSSGGKRCVRSLVWRWCSAGHGGHDMAAARTAFVQRDVVRRNIVPHCAAAPDGNTFRELPRLARSCLKTALQARRSHTALHSLHFQVWRNIASTGAIRINMSGALIAKCAPCSCSTEPHVPLAQVKEQYADQIEPRNNLIYLAAVSLIVPDF